MADEGKKYRWTRMTQPAQSEPPSPRRLDRGDTSAVLALSVLVAVSYLPAMLWGGFVWDDIGIIETQPVREAGGLWQIWFSPGSIARESHYWPLVYTTFWLEHKLWGFAPAGYHVVNVLLHAANTLLLWRLLRRLTVPGAWAIAAVFAVHPVHVESVAWVIERKDVLSSLFYLTAALTWMRWVESPRPGRYALALGLFAAGMLSKSMVVTLPAALLIWHWWKQGRVTARDLIRLTPLFAVGLAIAAGDVWYSRSVNPVSLEYSAIERMLIAARALWFYAGKLAWPADLAFVYPFWDVRVADPLGWGCAVAAAGLAVALWSLRHRIGRGPLAGALFFAVTLSPVLGFVDHNYMAAHAFVADRYQYLASAGLLAVIIGAAAHGVAAARAAGRLPDLAMKGVTGFMVVILAVLGTLTWRQAAIYSDPLTFNRHIISLNPRAWNAHLNLSVRLAQRERMEEALAASLAAVKLNPKGIKPNRMLGRVLFELGRFEEAEKHWRRVLELAPRYPLAHRGLGVALFKQGRLEESLAATRAALEQRPDWDVAMAGLGVILNELGRFDEAERHLRRARELHPRHIRILQNLGESLRRTGRHEEALDLYRSAVEIEPDYAPAHGAMGVILLAMRRHDEAIDAMQRAVTLAPDSPQAPGLHASLGKAARETGRIEMAARYYERALQSDPRYTDALLGLALVRFRQQRYDQARPLLQTIIEMEPGHALAHANMGVALYHLGHEREAVESIDRALALDPTLEHVRAGRTRILESMANDAGSP